MDTVDGVAETTFTAGDTLGQATIIATTGQVTDTVKVEITRQYDVYLPLVLRNHG